MAQIIPWQNNPDFQFEAALDGTVYLLRARWNVVAQAWALDILSRATTPLLLGIRLVRNADLLARTAVVGAPPGGLYLLGDEPTYDSLIQGATQLVYLPAAEAAEALA